MTVAHKLFTELWLTWAGEGWVSNARNAGLCKAEQRGFKEYLISDDIDNRCASSLTTTTIRLIPDRAKPAHDSESISRWLIHHRQSTRTPSTRRIRIKPERRASRRADGQQVRRPAYFGR